MGVSSGVWWNNPIPYKCTMIDWTRTSSNVYHIAPQTLRDLRMERRGKGGVGRHRDNAYDGKEETKDLTREQKEARYDELKESIRVNGFDKDYPILIMLRREGGEDKIFEGHHRLNIAIELGLETVPVRFIEWQKEYNEKGRYIEKM